MAIHIKDKADFDLKLAEASGKLVVVDFFATWCGPCKIIAPKLEELAKEFAGSIVVFKVDVDECEELAIQFEIASMPTFVFLKSPDSKVVHQFSGANYDKLRSTIMELK